MVFGGFWHIFFIVKQSFGDYLIIVNTLFSLKALRKVYIQTYTMFDLINMLKLFYLKNYIISQIMTISE